MAGSSSTAPAAPDLTGLELAREGIEVPRGRVADADAVDVAVHEDLEVPRADPRDHGAETVEEDLVEAERLVLTAHPFAAIRLLPALGGDGDEIPEEPDNLLLV